MHRTAIAADTGKGVRLIRIQIDFPDDKAGRILAAHNCADAAALRDLLKALVVSRTRDHEAQAAAGAAERAARTKADTDFGTV